MFFKRISDVYLEEYGVALADSGGDHEFASFAENHRFQIPPGCLWSDVRARTEAFGQALIAAMRTRRARFDGPAPLRDEKAVRFFQLERPADGCAVPGHECGL